MKRLLLCALLAFAPCLFAQTTTVTGSKVLDGSGGLLSSGQWCLGSSCFTVTAGAIAGGSTVPNPTTGTVTVTNGLGTTYLTIPSTNVFGTTFNWDLYIVTANQQATGMGAPHMACLNGATYTQNNGAVWACVNIFGLNQWSSQNVSLNASAGIYSGNGIPVFTCSGTCLYVQLDAVSTVSNLWIWSDAATSWIHQPVGGGAGSYTLPPATTSVLGGVKVGAGLSVTGGGILSVPYGTTSGTAVQGNDARILGALQDDGVNGILKRTGAATTGAAGFADVIALFSGGPCVGYLYSDGNCSTPPLPPATAIGQPLISTGVGTGYVHGPSALGTAAYTNSSAYDAAGAAATAQGLSLQIANNLSDLNNAATARTNLGLGTAATQASTVFLQKSNNLSDLASAATARTNLGLATVASTGLYSSLTGLPSIPVIPGSGVVKSTGSALADAASGDIIALFGAGSCTGYLKSDGTCAIPTGSGGGTVSSVGLVLPTSTFAVAGSPVTGSSTLTATYNTQAANTALLGPITGASATPTWRLFTAADIPQLAYSSLSGLPTIPAIPSAGVVKSNGTNFVNAASGDIIALFGSGSCSGFLKSDGTCASVSGTVSSGTILHIPIYAATGTTLSSDSLLTDDGTTLAYTGTGGVTAPKFSMSGTGGLTLTGVETTAPTGVALSDILWGDSTSHRWKMNPNNIGALNFVGIGTAGTSGDCVKFAANGIDLLDFGAACGSGGGSMVYPGAGIANSTGTAWGTSFSTSGSGSVALTTSPTFVTPTLGVATATSLNGLKFSSAGTNIANVGGAIPLTVTGHDLVAVGPGAMANWTTGTVSTAVGQNALAANQTGIRLTAFGTQALAADNGGSSNTAVGAAASASMVSGLNNTTMGDTAGGLDTSGSNNTAMGYFSLESNNGGSNNTAIGWEALTIGSGSNNTAVGYNAVAAANSASYITALGWSALNNNSSGAANTGVGAAALLNTSTGSNNTAIGYQAGYTSSTTGDNTFVGYQAGGLTATSTSSSVFVGSGAAPSATGFTNMIVIGQGATGTASNQVTLGNPSITSTLLRGLVSEPAWQSTGTAFTVASCGTPTATGGSSAGTFAAGSATCNPVITPGFTAAHGWVCTLQDETTAAASFRQSGHSATTATFAGTSVVSSDVIVVKCAAF
jgi:hypothetical protein